MQSHCDICAGKGKVVKTKCLVCKGKKTRRGSNEISVTIEKGMLNGQKIVLEKEGDQNPDVTSGDIIFTLNTLEHPVFTRDGDHLRIKQTISLKEGLLGFKKDLVHLDGSHLVIEKHTITQPGIFCYSKSSFQGFIQMVKHQGMPTHEFSSERGHLFIEYQVIFPEGTDYTKNKGKDHELFFKLTS